MFTKIDLIFIIINYSAIKVLCQNNNSLASVYTIEQFQSITDEKIYNKWVYPDFELPIKVKIGLFLHSFGTIDETRTEYSIQLLLRIGWKDQRLVVPTNTSKPIKIEGGRYHVDRIWTPSIHIPNNKEPEVLQKDDQIPVLAHIFTDGSLLVSKRILLNGFCKMDFRLYPLDIQLCDIEIESNDLSDEHLRLEWVEEQPFDMTDDFSWSGFALVNYSMSHLKAIYSHTGTFSKLVVTFKLKREFGHFILDIYIPSMMFVITSWTTFWVEIPAAPARVTLGITTMLTLVTSAKTARDKLPRVSYIHALDIWILMCTFFVFASLIEYATVNFIYNKDKRSKKKRTPIANNTAGLSRNVSVTSFRSMASDSMYSTLKSVKSEMFLKPPASPMGLRRSVSGVINTSFIKDMDEGGIEFIVPSLQKDNSYHQPSIAPSMGSAISALPAMPAKVKSEPHDIANNIDQKSRIIFPLSFLLFNIVYWTTLALLSYV